MLFFSSKLESLLLFVAFSVRLPVCFPKGIRSYMVKSLLTAADKQMKYASYLNFQWVIIHCIKKKRGVYFLFVCFFYQLLTEGTVRFLASELLM